MQASQNTWVQSVGQEDPLEKEMAIHSSILAWEIPWTEEPGGLYFMGLQRVRHNLATTSPPFYQAGVAITMIQRLGPWNTLT